MTRKPLRKFLPLTYPPKIPAVLDGTCTQTIRIDTSLTIGDFVAFHGWEGRPCHSGWSFRTPYAQIILAKLISVHKDHVYLPESKTRLNISDSLLDELARKEGIEPATGEELIRGLHAMHGPGTLYGKVLRWNPKPIIDDLNSCAVSLSEISDADRVNLMQEDEDRLLEEDRFIQTPISDPMRPKTVSPSAATLEDLFEEDPAWLAQPKINQRIFEKVRQVERDLSPGVQ